MNNRLLDLVFANYDCTVERSDFPLVKEDSVHHPALDIYFNLHVASHVFPGNPGSVRYNFSKANYPALYESLMHVDWTDLMECTDVNVACGIFYNILYSVFDDHVPYFRSTNSKYRYPVWYTGDIIRSIKEKSRCFERYKRSRLPADLAMFKRLRSRTKELIQVAYSQYLRHIESSIRCDTRGFWSYVRARKRDDRIPGRMFFDARELVEPQDIVDTFSRHFASVYRPSKLVCPNDWNNQDGFISAGMPIVVEKDIVKAIKKLKNKFTAGHDQVPSFLVKDCCYVLTRPLQILFNLALRTSTFPAIWKLSRVCPVLKSGNAADIRNYRPISILPNFSKVFECVIYDYIYSAVSPSVADSQHGFIRGRSTVTNLMSLTQHACSVVDKRGQLDVVYTDFAKAFDRLDHCLLLQKLAAFDVNNFILRLLRSYLLERRFSVSYKGHDSAFQVATSGVPQGSNLGPLLFIAFINDIVDAVTCEILLFADDVKLFRPVSSVDDCISLQLDVDRIYRWSTVNGLELNVSKCSVVSFTRRLCPIIYEYNINEIALPRLLKIKDLGILFDCALSFREHVSGMVSDANKMLGFILRTCRKFKNIPTFMILYNSLVRSKLEYGSIIWNPYYNAHILSLENVQRKLLKYLAFRVDGVYPARGIPQGCYLKRFDVLSLQCRRCLNSLRILYGILHGAVSCPAILQDLNFIIPRHSARYINTFQLPTSRTNLMLKSPINFMCGNYNSICMNCDIFYCSVGNLCEIFVSLMNQE